MSSRCELSVFDAKLLTQTDCPASATEGTARLWSAGAIRIGSPILFPECKSIRTTVPSSLSETNTESAVAISPLGLAPTRIGWPTVGGARIEPDDLCRVVVGEPDASAGDDDSDRDAAHVSPFDRVRRRVDPQHFPGVGGRHPEVAVAGGQRQRAAGREWKGGRDWLERPRVDPQQRPGPCFEGPQVAAPEDGLIDGRVEPATGQHGAAPPIETASSASPDLCWTGR